MTKNTFPEVYVTPDIKLAMGPGYRKQAAKAALLSLVYTLVALLRIAAWFCFGCLVGYILSRLFGEAAMVSAADTMNTTLGTTWFSPDTLVTTFAAVFAAWRVL